MFERILTEEGFNKVYPILEQSFPETELRTREDQLALLQNERYRLYAVKDEKNKNGGVIAGKAESWIWRECAGYVSGVEMQKGRSGSGIAGRRPDTPSN